MSFNDCFKVHISYFKDFDRNFQNNYYFVLFPSIQFLNNLRQLRLTLPSFSRQPIHNNTGGFYCQAIFKTFLIFFEFFLTTKYCVCPFFRPNILFPRMPKSFVIYLRFSMYNALSISEHIELYIRLNFKSSDFHYFFKLFRFFSTFYFKSSLPLGSEARNCPFYKHYILYISLFKAKSFYKTDFSPLLSYERSKI